MFRDRVYTAYARFARSSRVRKRKPSESGRFLFIFLISCGVLGLNTDASLIYQLFAFLFCITVVSRLAIRFQKPALRVQRFLPKYGTVGESYNYTLAITNLGSRVESDLTIIDNPKNEIPTRTQFNDQKEPNEASRNAYDRFIGFHRFMYLQRQKTGITVEKSHLDGLPIKATSKVMMTADFLRRGVVNFTSTTIMHPDPLNLNFGLSHFQNPASILVLPKRYPISTKFNFAGGRHFQPGGINAAWSIGESDEFVSLRDYRDGDSMRKIHWGSTAKRNKPVVKEFQDEYFMRQALVLDLSSTDEDMLEEAISIAASFTMSMNKADAVLDLLFLSNKAEILTSGRGTDSINKQLEALATMKLTTLPFETLKVATLNHSRFVSTCILVLSSWGQDQAQLVKSLVATNTPCKVLLLTKGDSSPSSLPNEVILIPLNNITAVLSGL